MRIYVRGLMKQSIQQGGIDETKVWFPRKQKL